ncbi:MAG: tetratricopeptide repeat-containing glycosyltransferase family protein [Burkholderiales bacterium]|nr:tetratricopeptide repeat-containing glycosyltransferase family protein [Burkholderiales bacterium]
MLEKANRLPEAEAVCRSALELKPDSAVILYNLGIILKKMNRLLEAEKVYRHTIELKPEYADGHCNLAFTLLKLGNMKAGWEEYEWRWATPQMFGARRDFTQPQWRGEAAKGKTLLIHLEGGFGDTLQFCRYAQLAAARGLHIILLVPSPLVRLLQSLPGVDRIIESGELLPAFDFHCPMLSLPLAFGTDLATIPSTASYLQADKAQVDAWHTRLTALSNKSFRIGLAWAGDPRSNFPHLTAVDRRRSMSPELLAPLFNLTGFHFFSLQKDGRKAPNNFLLTDFMDEMEDFADTAALISNLDLVISVDTAVAHLAAALGKPVWVLDRFDSCWRWLNDREDSPWYPSLRLFRQPQPGDWQSVIERVVGELPSLHQ